MLSCLEMAENLMHAADLARSELKFPTEVLMQTLEIEAKAYIGEYQDGWAPLAESTLQGWHGHPGKIELGYAPPDNPLLREGHLRDSIEHWSASAPDGAVGQIGSNDPIALWQELGTVKIPPRPFIGLSMFRSEEHAVVIFGNFAVKLLTE